MVHNAFKLFISCYQLIFWIPAASSLAFKTATSFQHPWRIRKLRPEAPCQTSPTFAALY
jgi:hypothetical protein